MPDKKEVDSVNKTAEATTKPKPKSKKLPTISELADIGQKMLSNGWTVSNEVGKNSYIWKNPEGSTFESFTYNIPSEEAVANFEESNK